MTVAEARAAQLQQRINELMLENDNLDQDRGHAEQQCGALLVGLQDARDLITQLRGEMAEICEHIDELMAR